MNKFLLRERTEETLIGNRSVHTYCHITDCLRMPHPLFQSQRRVYPIEMNTFHRSYDVLLAFFTLFAVNIMTDMPAVSLFDFK